MATTVFVGIGVHGGRSKCPSVGETIGNKPPYEEILATAGNDLAGPNPKSDKDFQGPSKDPRPLVRSPPALPSLVCFSLDLEGTRIGPE